MSADSARPVATPTVPASMDPTTTDPDLYHVVFENDRVRVLEYRDVPGDATHLHGHPDSVMVTLSGFRRRLSRDGREVEVDLTPHTVRWLDAQQHCGTNIGDTDSHAVFIELKEPSAAAAHSAAPDALGPAPGPARS